MTPFDALSVALVLVGAGFLSAAFLMSFRSTASVPAELRGRWRFLSHLIVFFVAGYAVFLFRRLPVRGASELLPAAVFFGGAVFVFLVIGLTRRTIARLAAEREKSNEANRLLQRANAALRNEVNARRKAEAQARSRLQHLATLHAIDTIITSNLDLRVTLKVFLEHITPQLAVHATDVLLLNPHTQFLDFAAGRGFLSERVADSSERLGEGTAGRAALERRVIHIPDLAKADPPFARRELIERERFVSYCAIPLVAKGQIKGVLEIFHREPLRPDPEWYDFLEALAVQAAIAIDNATLFNDLQRSNAELILSYDSTIEGWARALELRDKETEGHTQRVTDLTLKMARAWGMSAEELVHVRRGALLHDMGKMAVPDDILMKTGPLTPEEQEVMRQHPARAFEMLSPIAYLRPALDIPYCHHERWDGTGYPRGLKGEQIPIAARIFAVADTWDALLSDRRYHDPWPVERVKAYIRDLSGTQFDPAVVELFFDVIEERRRDPVVKLEPDAPSKN